MTFFVIGAICWFLSIFAAFALLFQGVDSLACFFMCTISVIMMAIGADNIDREMKQKYSDNWRRIAREEDICP